MADPTAPDPAAADAALPRFDDGWQPQAILFDCDGTLADTMPLHYRAWQAALQPHAIAFPEDRFYAMGGIPTPTITAILAREQGRDVDVDVVAHDKEQRFLHLLAEVKPVPEVYDVAKKNRGVRPIAVVTGGLRHVVTQILEQLAVSDWFPVVVSAEDTARHKPEPDAYLLAAQRLAVDPSQCLVYEDTDIGMHSARAAGARAVDVRHLRKRADAG